MSQPTRVTGALGTYAALVLRGAPLVWTAVNLALAVILWSNPSFASWWQALVLGLVITVGATLPAALVVGVVAALVGRGEGGSAAWWEALWVGLAGAVLGWLGALLWVTDGAGSVAVAAVVAVVATVLVRWLTSGRDAGRAPAGSRWVWLVSLIAVLGLALRGPLKPTAFAADKPPILVFGVDGATWNVIDPLIQAGELPNWKRLVDRGVHGDLTTLDPLFSPVIWTTVATGKLPEKHGVTVDRLGQEWVRNRRLWQMFDDAGYGTMVFGYLLTWPPKAVETTEVIVPGWVDAGLDTYPEDYRFITEMTASARMGQSTGLGTQLRYAMEAAMHGVRLDTFLQAAGTIVGKLRGADRRLAWARDRFLKQRIHADLFEQLYAVHSPEFAIFYNNLNDALQHKFWHYAFPDDFANIDLDPAEVERYGALIRDGYRATDRIIGEMLELLPEDGTMYIVSDHGFKSRARLAEASDVGRFFRVLPESFLELTDLEDQLMGINLLGGVTTFGRLPDAAISDEEVLAAIEEPRLASTGQPILQAAVNAEGYFEVGVTPIPELDLDTMVEVDGESFPARRLIMEEERASGWHSYEGVLIGMGPRLREGHEYDASISILDVAPLMLYGADLPVAEDMDGEVPLSIFADPYVESNPVRAVATYDKEPWTPPEGAEGMTDEQRETLRSLGYIN